MNFGWGNLRPSLMGGKQSKKEVVPTSSPEASTTSVVKAEGKHKKEVAASPEDEGVVASTSQEQEIKHKEDEV